MQVIRTNKIKTGIGGLLLLLSLTRGAAYGQADTEEQARKTAATYAKSLDREKKLDYNGAIKNMQELPDSAAYEYNLRLGWLCYKAGHEKQSLRYYNKAVMLKPQAIEPRLGYGYPAYLLEDMSHLIEQDKKILEIDPNNKITNSNLGLIYFYNKEYAKALPYFQKVVQLYPFDYDNNLSLGWTCLHLGKKAEAEKCFNTALLYSPTDASAREGLDALGKPVKDNDALLAAFAKSIELSTASNFKGAAAAIMEVYDKSSYYMNLRLGWLYHLAGQANESLNYYKLAVALMPGSVEAKLGSALPNESMGNKGELKAIYESVIAIDPKNTAMYYKIAILLCEKKDYAAAVTSLEKVMALYPFDYDGLLLYAWAKYYTGQNAESRALFYKVLCLSPGDKSASAGLAMKPADDQKKAEQEPVKPREIIRPR